MGKRKMTKNKMKKILESLHDANKLSDKDYNEIINELVISNKFGKIRKFKTGATRDTNEGKYDYEGFLSPLVIEAYGKYMHKHRKQSDGTLRDSDNWQKGFGENHFAVCIKSLWRHFLDLWFLHRGYKRFDKKDGHEITKEEVLMAILFNDMAYADKLLKEKEK